MAHIWKDSLSGYEQEVFWTVICCLWVCVCVWVFKSGQEQLFYTDKPYDSSSHWWAMNVCNLWTYVISGEHYETKSTLTALLCDMLFSIMLFVRTVPAVVFWQWVNQSLSTWVNDTNWQLQCCIILFLITCLLPHASLLFNELKMTDSASVFIVSEPTSGKDEVLLELLDYSHCTFPISVICIKISNPCTVCWSLILPQISSSKPSLNVLKLMRPSFFQILFYFYLSAPKSAAVSFSSYGW